MGWTWNALWHLVTSTTSLATLVGIGAVAVAILTPPLVARFIPNLRVVAIVVAVAAFSYTSVGAHFYAKGLAVKQAEWAASLAKEADDGGQILDDARRDAARDTPDSLRNHPWNRDLREQPLGK